MQIERDGFVQIVCLMKFISFEGQARQISIQAILQSVVHFLCIRFVQESPLVCRVNAGKYIGDIACERAIGVHRKRTLAGQAGGLRWEDGHQQHLAVGSIRQVAVGALQLSPNEPNGRLLIGGIEDQ